jgi:spore coat polysaccharide biosynthesis predicted glycosyltransferase SpsG
MNILFRCDGSLEIGLGHIVRCLALADEFRDNHNCEVYFAIRKSELGIKQVEPSYPVLTSNAKAFNYKEWIVECIGKSKAQILILDVRDNLSINDLLQIKKKSGVRVVTIDDPEDKRLSSDLAFFPPVPQVQHMRWDDYKGQLFVGWEYVILRKEFCITYQSTNSTCPNILISMGGTDEFDLTNFATKSIDTISENFSATIILGPGYAHEVKLRKLLSTVNFPFSIYRDPQNMAMIMSKSDIALISFGQTAYELAALHIPSLYLCLTEDHQESASLFVKEGIGFSLGLLSVVESKHVAASVSTHITDKLKLQMMYEMGMNLPISDLNQLSKTILEGV